MGVVAKLLMYCPFGLAPKRAASTLAPRAEEVDGKMVMYKTRKQPVRFKRNQKGSTLLTYTQPHKHEGLADSVV
jgi:hypothetical protein